MFTSNSINIVQDNNLLDTEYLGLKVNPIIVNSIIKLLLEKKISLKEIYSNLEFSHEAINKTVIIMLKFDIIGITKKA